MIYVLRNFSKHDGGFPLIRPAIYPLISGGVRRGWVGCELTSHEPSVQRTVLIDFWNFGIFSSLLLVFSQDFSEF